MRFPDSVLEVVFTDATGSVLFNVLPDSYMVRASKAAYVTDQISVDLRRGDAFRQVTLQLRPDEPSRVSAAEGIVSLHTLSIPESALSEFRRGAELLNAKKGPKESISHFQKAIDAFPAYHEAYFLMGMAYLQTNKLKEAQLALGKAIELDPKFLQAYYPLSVVLISLKRYGEAEGLLLRAMELDPKGWQWPFELARCYGNQGQWDKALVHAKMVLDRPDPPSKVHLLMADLYSNTGQTAEAVKELEQFMILDPKSPYFARAKKALEQLRAQKAN